MELGGHILNEANRKSEILAPGQFRDIWAGSLLCAKGDLLG